MLKTIAVATLLCLAPLAYAQAPAPDQKAAPEKGQKLREARDKARAACQGKQGAEHRDCMEHEFCAQAKDPSKCEERLKARIEKRRQGKQ